MPPESSGLGGIHCHLVKDTSVCLDIFVLAQSIFWGGHHQFLFGGTYSGYNWCVQMPLFVACAHTELWARRHSPISGVYAVSKHILGWTPRVAYFFQRISGDCWFASTSLTLP